MSADAPITEQRRVGTRHISVGHDAVGNILVTGDQNTVSLTVVVADQRLLSVARVTGTSVATSEGTVYNPYPGLDAFGEADADWFFGREKLIQRAWIQFQSFSRILPIVGASGSGKSSLVRAGLLPELARNPIIGFESCRVLVLRPGPFPLRRLAEVFARLPTINELTESALLRPGLHGDYDALRKCIVGISNIDQSPLVLVVDRFEEIYTECQDADARTAFLANLEFAATDNNKFLSLLLTLRNDFASAITSPPLIAKALRENRLMVQAMDRFELEQAIALPKVATLLALELN